MTKEEFEVLISKYLSGKASAAEERLMEDFFASQEKKHAREHDIISEAMWTSITERIHYKDPKRKNKIHLSGRRAWVAVSAVLVMAVTFAVVYQRGFFSAPAKTQQWITLDSPNGQKSIITLADGSRIFLNAGSTIRYPEVFLPEKREVKLSGEAFFEITPNPKQPFMVTAGNVTTKVLGTSFNVQAFPDKQISVTVATGRVEVEATGEAQDSTERDRVILKPNDQAIYSPDHNGIMVNEVNIEKYLAWKDNTLFFENASIGEVAKTLERWYNATITFDNDRIKNCRISGKYKDQSLESVLKSIQYMYHVDFKFSFPNKVSLNGKDCNAQPMNL